MSQLKKSTVKLVYDALDNKIFSSDDFAIEFPQAGDTLVKIQFVHNEEYYFHIVELPKSKGIAAAFAAVTDNAKAPSTIECPGDYKRVEENRFESFDSCIRRIQIWCGNLRADLNTRMPVYQYLEELKRQFEKHIHENIEQPDDPLSEIEIQKIYKKFDSLYEEFQKLSEENKITKSQLEEVRKEFDIIKNNANDYPKGMWATLTKNRIVQVMKKVALSPEGRQILQSSVKRILGLD